MELLWNDLGVLRLIYRGTEQVEVGGSIQPPAGCRAAELLDCSADVEILNCKTESGKLSFDGRLSVAVTAADESGDAFAFVGEAPFSHCTENEAFATGTYTITATSADETKTSSVRLGQSFKIKRRFGSFP